MTEQSQDKAKKTPSTHDKRIKTGKTDSVELTEDELKDVSGGTPPTLAGCEHEALRERTDVCCLTWE